MNRSQPRRTAQAILLGVALIARGRAEGIALFGDTPQAFLASLAPLIAFPLVGAFLLALGGKPGGGVLELAESLCVLLGQPVISQVLARLWDRNDLWLRYATAFNWCQWVIPMLASVLIIVMGVLITLGMPPAWAAPVLIAVIGAYGLWLQWFLARQALRLSWPKAAAMVVLVNLGTAIILLVPRLLGVIA